MRSLRAWLKKLVQHTSGNATVLVAIGLPMMLGAAGLAVDLSQWYTWRNEMQYAADQAALAGAWARTSSSTQDIFVSRARTEYTANLSLVSSFADTPAVALVNFGGSATPNAVSVFATATQTLPFTGMLINRGVTIKVAAEATFAAGQAYTSCIVATDPTGSGSVTISGTTILTAACGIAALSTSDSSVVVNGNPTIDAGWILSKGGIDDWFNLHTNDEVHEYMSGLYDPFASLSPPTNTTARSYSCTGGTTSTTATTTVTTTTTYAYYQGSSQNSATPYTYSNPKPTETTSPVVTNNVAVAGGTYEGMTSISTSTNWPKQNFTQNGNTKIWEVPTVTTNTTYSNVVSTTVGQTAALQPGTYTGGFNVSCVTTMASGIYVINGGGVDISGQYQVTGNGIMFVLKNGAYIKINGGSAINLTAASSTQLQAAGVSATQANLLAGLMIFEDRNSSGSDKTNINGNNTTVLNGYLYFPRSQVNFSGTATVTSQCLMLVARYIVLSGTTNMTTFCPAGMTETTNVSGATPTVRLVA